MFTNRIHIPYDLSKSLSSHHRFGSKQNSKCLPAYCEKEIFTLYVNRLLLSICRWIVFHKVLVELFTWIIWQKLTSACWDWLRIYKTLFFKSRKYWYFIITTYFLNIFYTSQQISLLNNLLELKCQLMFSNNWCGLKAVVKTWFKVWTHRGH